MTKVRTILAEFCSPKEIQAINRLGLIKKEERESQPIPWRHRLPNAERRELVLSEMKMSLRPAPRLTNRDMVKAVATARNSIDSKMGECLLNSRTRQDAGQGSNQGRLNREERRLSRSHQHARETFLKRSKTMSHEPLILVERPPKGHEIYFNERETKPSTVNMPGYMRPLQSRSKTPSKLSTIEAFILDTRKKKNVWEDVLDKVPKFKSAIAPSMRLTIQDVSLLQIGHMLHKPTPEGTATRTSDPARGTGIRKRPSVFITQMQQKDMCRMHQTHLSRSGNETFPEIAPATAIGQIDLTLPHACEKSDNLHIKLPTDEVISHTSHGTAFTSVREDLTRHDIKKNDLLTLLLDGKPK